MTVRIFVEGDADVKFIKDITLHFYDIKLTDNDIIKTDGWTTIKSKREKGENIRNKLIENSDGNNLIIFDADDDFAIRRNEIEQWKVEFELEFDLFLFPNNINNGELENLLETIIKIENKPIFDCWNSYETCLLSYSSIREKPLTVPAKKSKIYTYIETLVGNSHSEKEKIKDKNRDFRNIEHWNLNSDTIIPLKDFLDKYFDNENI